MPTANQESPWSSVAEANRSVSVLLCVVQLGSKIANITEALLCASTIRHGGGGGVRFSFDRAEAGRDMHGSFAAGLVRFTPVQTAAL